MEEIMCDYSLEHYRSRPAQLGEKYETHQFGSWSIGFIAPGDASTAICMACDTKLRLEGIPELIQRRLRVSANENVTFTRLEAGPHHDGVRFANGAEVTLRAWYRCDGICRRSSVFIRLEKAGCRGVKIGNRLS